MSFDVESLFTNVPLNRTLKVIVKRIFTDKLINTNLSKNTLRKLIRDTCTKTVFSCNDTFYEQIDGVSMGGSLGPVLANIIMTEFEEKTMTKLIDSGTVKFYCRYVDDTLLLVKPNSLPGILSEFHKFDKNIRFTYDCFDGVIPHFLDIEIAPDGLSIYRKDTFTGLYTNFDSFVPWSHRVAWVKSLIYRVLRICAPGKVNAQLLKIRQFLAWNGFPRRVADGLINRTKASCLYKTLSQDHAQETVSESRIIWINMPYIGEKGEQLTKSLVHKLRRCIPPSKNVLFRILPRTNKISFYTNTKDKTPLLSKSNLVYQFTCPCCNSSYIGKTERTLYERTMEHARDKDSAICYHLNNCEKYQHLLSLFNFPCNNSTLVNTKEFYLNTVRDNTSIIDMDNNWNILLFKEAFYITRRLAACTQAVVKLN